MGEVEPEAYVVERPPRRALARTGIVLGAAVLVAVPLLAGVGRGATPAPMAAHALPTLPATPVPDTAPATTAVAPTTVAPRSASGAVTARPRTTGAPRASTSQSTSGSTLTIDREGIWVVDLQTKTLRRLTGVGPFDTAGDAVLVGQGRTVFTVPVSGGEPRAVYTLPTLVESGLSNGWTVAADREAVTMLIAAADGTAFVASGAPMLSPAGEVGGNVTGYHLVTPDGTVRPTAFQDRYAQWSGDGSTLVAYDYTGLRAVHRDGTPAWGPVTVGNQGLQGMGVSHDGRTVLLSLDAARIRRYRVDTGSWDDVTPIFNDMDFAPDGRVVAQPTPPPGWTGFDPLGLVEWDPASGAVTRFSATGSGPRWSPDGGHIAYLDDGANGYAFHVSDASGAPLLAVQPGSKALRLAYDDNGYDHSWPGPQWSADGRYLVILASSPFTGPMPR